MSEGPYADSQCSNPKIVNLIGKDRVGRDEITKLDGKFAWTDEEVTVDTPPDDWDPGTPRTQLNLTATSPQTIHGLVFDAAAGGGETRILINTSAHDLTFLADSASSAAAKNRFTQGFILPQNAVVKLHRANGRWAVHQGAGDQSRWRTVTVDVSQINDVGDLSKTIVLENLVDDTEILASSFLKIVDFAGGPVTTLTVELGDGSDADRYAKAYELVGGSPGDKQYSPMVIPELTDGVVPLTATFTANAALNNLNQGTLDIRYKTQKVTP